MFFLTNAWRYLRMGTSAVGMLAGIGVIAFGAISALPSSTAAGVFFIVAGGLEIVLGLFNFYDSSKVWAEMKQKFDELSKMLEKFSGDLETFKQENENLRSEREKFAEQNETLSSNVQNLTTTEKSFESENEKLKIIVEENKNQLLSVTQHSQELEEQLRQLKEQKDEYAKQNKEFSLQNTDLRGVVEKIKDTQRQLQLENATYRDIQTRLENQVRVLDGLKEDYKHQNEEMQLLIAEQLNNLNDAQSQIDTLKTQLDRFVGLYENMKALVKNLVAAGDMYKDFANTIGDDVSKLDVTATNVEGAVSDLMNIVNRLNTKMTEEDFKELDVDGDGTITKEEWENKFGKMDN